MTILSKKGIIISVLALIAALTGGCTSRADEGAFLSYREGLAAAKRISAEARLTVSESAKVAEYVLAAEYADGETTVTVKEPECIAGVRARIAREGDALEYDGVTLSVPELSANGLTPVTALHSLIRAISEAHVESVWRGDGELAVELTASDAERLTVFFDAAFTPVRAEYIDAATGQTVIAMEIMEFHQES